MTPRSRRLAKALSEDPGSLRRLTSQENIDPFATNSTSIPFRWQLSQLTKKLYESVPKPSITSAAQNLDSHPITSLGALGLDEDFYSRPASWSKKDILAVLLHGKVAFRCMVTQTVNKDRLDCGLESSTCVHWNPDGTILGLGNDLGYFSAYDYETMIPLVQYEPDDEEDGVGDLSWRDSYTVAVAQQSGTMRMFDIRMKGSGKPTRIHKARACGLEWNPDGRYLASGGGDGTVICWDIRANKFLQAITPGSSSSSNSFPSVDCKWRARKHLTTVKALGWCPWAPSLLASGGGTKDGVIHFWDAARGEELPLSIETKAQVTSLHFSPVCREVVSTAGYPFTLAPSFRTDSRTAQRVLPAPQRHSILVHSYPRGNLMGKIFDQGHGRITHSCLSPDSTRLLTCGSDQSVRIYRVFGKQPDDVAYREDGMQNMNIIR